MDEKAIRVLVVDDDEEDALILADQLHDTGGHFLVESCTTLADGLARVTGRLHDVYLVDYLLGPDSGLDLIRRARAAGMREPMILMTGHGDEQVDRRALEAGAADYLVKGRADGEQISRSIRYALDRARHIAEREAGEMRYRMLFDKNPLPMWVYDPCTEAFLDVNEAAVRQYGWAREEFLAMSVPDIRSEAERAGYARDRVLAAAGYREAGVWKHRRKDGTQLYVDIVRHDLQYEGRPGRLVLARDVTRQVEAENSLRGNKEQLRQVLTDVRDGLVVIREDGIVCFANPAVREQLGLDPDALTGAPFPLPDCDSDGPRQIEVHGRTRHLEITRTATTWDEAPATLLALRDVTDRHEQEERLRLLNRAMESSANGIVIVDSRVQGQPIIYANPAFLQMTGYAMDEVIGRNCRFLQGAERDQAAIAQIREALRDERESNAVLKNVRKNGEEFWNDLHIAPVRNEAGKVTHYVGVLNDLTEQRRYEAERAYAASHDMLTGLPRFVGLEQLLEEMAADRRDDAGGLALLFIDLDHFKVVNETVGPDAGDHLLKIVAKRLRQAFPDAGTLARFAGDEFVAILRTGPGLPEPEAIAGRVRALLSQPVESIHYSLHPTCSIGIACWPEHTDKPAGLLRLAEAAMGRAKRQGRNRSLAFSEELGRQLADRLALGSRIRGALLNRELLLHYQPVFEAGSGRLAAFEALARWNSPALGMVSPTRFIGVAEELGLILDLGRWVIREACRQLSEWRAAGLPNVPLAVNVSALQVQQGDFASFVIGQMHHHGIPAGTLQLELTESALLSNETQVIDNLQALHPAGVRLALDDFGTGYSSLSYLKRLPFDTLKIDRDFVRNLPHDPDDAAIARTIVLIAHQLRMTVTAEGVETEAQRSFLQGLGCERLQGFLLGRPAPAEDAARLMAAPPVAPPRPARRDVARRD